MVRLFVYFFWLFFYPIAFLSVLIYLPLFYRQFVLVKSKNNLISMYSNKWSLVECLAVTNYKDVSEHPGLSQPTEL